MCRGRATTTRAQADALREFLATSPVVPEIESPSLLEPKIQIQSSLLPILSGTDGVPQTDAPPTSDDDTPPTAELPQDLRDRWHAAASAVVERLDLMSAKLDTMSPPLPTRDALKELLSSLGGLLGEPLQTRAQADALREFLATSPVVPEIESSSLLEPKIQIRSSLEPILSGKKES